MSPEANHSHPYGTRTCNCHGTSQGDQKLIALSMVLPGKLKKIYKIRGNAAFLEDGETLVWSTSSIDQIS